MSLLVLFFVLSAEAICVAAFIDLSAVSQQAASGQVDAMLALADYYRAGEKKTLDPAAAYAWYLKAAELGSARAQTELGVMLELGRGVRQDDEAAVAWYRKAADQGFARAQTDLAFMYETGKGIMLDYRQALGLYTAAAKQGYARGQVMLGAMYEKGLGVDRDSAQALSWYKAAARQGYARGQVALGKLYEAGLGVAPDPETARAWYAKAARQGNTEAKKRLQAFQVEASGASSPSTTLAEGEAVALPTMAWQPPVVIAEKIRILHELARYEIAQTLPRLPERESEEGGGLLASVMQMECSDVNLPYLDAEILSAQASRAKGDLGFRFDSGYRMRDTTDSVDAKRQRAHVGLSWDLLDEGLNANQSASRRYDYQRQIAEVRAEKDRHTDLFTCRDTYLIQRFNVWKNAIQKRRAEVLDTYLELSRRDYFAGYRTADEVLKIELELRKTRQSIGKFDRQGAEILDQGQFDAQELPPFLELDLAELTKAIDTDPAYAKISALSEAVVQEKHDPLHDKRLRLYVENEIMEDTELGSGAFTGGVTFSTPIFRPMTNDVLPVELLRARAAIAKEKEILRAEVTRLHNAYGEKLVDAIKMVYRQKIVNERLRRALLRLQPSNRPPGQSMDAVKDQLLVIELLQELLDTRYELIAVQEGLYRHLLHTFTLAQTGWRQEFTRLTALDFDLQRGRSGVRAIYVWSAAFAGTDNTFLVQALEAKAVSTVILSAAEKVLSSQKFADFVKLAALHRIKIELLLSDNSWIEPEKWPKAEAKIRQLLALGQSIHLDIEPHTLPDYKQKRSAYNQAFVELIGKIRRLVSKETGLAISLPTLYDQELITAISPLVDRIYIMAYGKAAQGAMEKKLSSFAKVQPEKLVLALRPDDFGSELDLERFIDQVSREHGLHAFAFHDLPQFLRMGGRQESL